MEPDMLEAHYVGNPWKMMVACVLLNRTKRQQVDKVIEHLFSLYPEPYQLACARLRYVSGLIANLGLQNRRAKTLIEMSAWFAKRPNIQLTTVELSKCPGIGRFALDAYRVFELGDMTTVPEDKELLKYLEWRLNRSIP